MRTNLPVTGKEVLLDEGQTIVSKTDLKGRITYVNHAFVEISGYSEQELVGQPHNIVRHPDTPAAVFADMWGNLSAGRPWTGCFKNRSKNGDYYWVKPNATPILENGEITGYMSVHEKPSRDAVANSEAAYASMRAGNSGLTIVEGRAMPDNKLKLLWRKITVGQRVVATLAFLLVVMVVQGLLGLTKIGDQEALIKNLYEEHVAEIDELKHVGDLYAVQYATTFTKAFARAITPEEALAQIAAARKAHGSVWPDFAHKDHPAEERVVIDRITQKINTADKVVAEGERLLASKELASFGAFLTGKIYPAFDPVSAELDALIDEILEGAKKEYGVAEADYAATVKQLIAVTVAIVALTLILGVLLLRTIRRPIDQAAGYFRQFAEGRLDADIVIGQRDEMSAILDSAKSMQVKLGFEMAEARRQADEMTRVKIALDNVSTGVMIADSQRRIIYANTSVIRLLKDAESAIRTQLPGFQANTLIGQSIDQFHKQPAHQESLLARLTAAHTAKFEMGGRHMVVTASPVRNERNERLGTVAEWVDRTSETLIEKEVGDIVASASRGELSSRLDMKGKSGFYALLSGSLNQLLEATQTSLETTSTVLDRVAHGDLSQTIEGDFSGIFGKLKDDTNATIFKLREVIGEIQEASDAIKTASNEIATGNSDLSSRTEEQASSLEETSSSMEQLNATVKQNADNASQANELSKSSNEAVTRGGAMVRQVIDTMGGIQESSKKIADIIGVIDSIAFQTNILALNAAVEAARAGEQGRGFAVVATEVRNLAQRSATAAKEIKELIAESVAKVDGGVRLVSDAGTTMDDVVRSFSQVAALVTEISNASREQSAGIEQVTQAVSQMDEVTQQNAALVEQAAAAAESLEEQAGNLVRSVAMFRLSTHAAAAPAQRGLIPPSPPRPALPRAAKTPGKPIQKKRLPAVNATSDDAEWAEF